MQVHGFKYTVNNMIAKPVPQLVMVLLVDETGVPGETTDQLKLKNLLLRNCTNDPLPISYIFVFLGCSPVLTALLHVVSI
jgi:hypothetical protein